MAIKINSATFTGINGRKIDVEIDISNGLPAFNIVGLPDTSVKESKERVRSAIVNSGFEFPMRRIVINLAPADIKKEGSLLDLPIALSILIATSQISVKNIKKFIFLGELSLLGELKRINGGLPIVIDSINNGIKDFIVPMENANECSLVDEARIFPFEDLKQVVEFLKFEDLIPYKYKNSTKKDLNYTEDFSDVIGQESCKRSIEVAAAGGHNMLMFGPPGCGKTMIAKRIPTILPKLSYEEILEITKIYSISNNIKSDLDLVRGRPFRSPHHTSSQISLIGGGNKLMPGEISLAHNGVLFLDEILEFKRNTLEVLRQPLEERMINISRASGKVTYPANFMLIASMNPCPCGNFSSANRECTCTEYERKRYLNKLSKPLLDRIDIFSCVSDIPYGKLRKNEFNNETSKDIRKRVENARNIQKKRFANDGIYCNAQMNQRLLRKYCKIGEKSDNIIEKIYEKFNLSARSYSRILKVARTISDLKNKNDICEEDVIEALQYRRFVENKII